ncbi:hypothetical protein MAFF211479_20120 [Ralstonia solanacearum]|nr:hypothetical protein MAFF211479_20120 [Ralstonia solanacearum]BCN04877.1 hypothetical protein RPSB_20140 [Ralstonia solanacearum]
MNGRQRVVSGLLWLAVLLPSLAFADTVQCDPAITCMQVVADMVTQLRDVAVKSMQVMIACAASIGFLLGLVAGRLR